MPRPSDSSQPRFASGCRWGTQGEERVVLFPEGMIRVQGTGQNILELCDGQRTVQEIVTALSETFSGAIQRRFEKMLAVFWKLCSRSASSIISEPLDLVDLL